MGDTDSNLARAIKAIDALPDISVEAVSGIYRTEPQEKKEQAWFTNQVIRVACSAKVTPQALLSDLLSIESSMGRSREGCSPEDRFGPRIIDLDVLLFGDSVVSTDFLMLPHPRMQQRAFVLVPLRDVAPDDFAFPDGKTLVQALNALEYKVENDQIWQ